MAPETKVKMLILSGRKKMSRFLVKTTTTHTGCNQMAWRVGAKINNSDSQVWRLGQQQQYHTELARNATFQAPA